MMSKDKNWTKKRIEEQIRLKLKQQKKEKNDTKERN